ncbi:MAG: hypothetical protein KDA72_11970, partial [Planctomycetales bacterium]|nr:hypothetical protein [Planctomycetales bacterium]
MGFAQIPWFNRNPTRLKLPLSQSRLSSFALLVVGFGKGICPLAYHASQRMLVFVSLLSLAIFSQVASGQVPLDLLTALPERQPAWRSLAQEKSPMAVVDKTAESKHESVENRVASAARTTVGSENPEAGEGSSPDTELSTDGSAKEVQSLQKKFDERLKELEEQFQTQADAKKKADDAANKKPTFELGGRIHLDYWTFPASQPGLGFLEHPNPALPNFGDDPEDRFLFRRIRLEMQGDIPTRMLWRTQMDFNNPSNPEYKDAYLGWNELPGNHTFLVGNQKRPLGLDHLNSSRFNVFMERPLVVEAFNEDSRRIGACLYGHSNDESLNWRYGIFNLENTSATGRHIGDSLQMAGYGRLVASPWYSTDGRCYSHLAIAGAIARPNGDATPRVTNHNEGRFRTRPEARTDTRWLDTGPIAGADWYEILAAESIINNGPFQLTGEYMVNFLQRDSMTPGTGPDTFFHGFYVYGAYFLTGEHMAYDRTSGTLDRVKPHKNFFLADRMCGRHSGSGWGAWQIVARYDYLD